MEEMKDKKSITENKSEVTEISLSGNCLKWKWMKLQNQRLAEWIKIKSHCVLPRRDSMWFQRCKQIRGRRMAKDAPCPSWPKRAAVAQNRLRSGSRWQESPTACEAKWQHWRRARCAEAGAFFVTHFPKWMEHLAEDPVRKSRTQTAP